MARLIAAVVTLALCAGAPAAAQTLVPLSPEITREPPLHLNSRPFSFPVIEYTAPDGQTRPRRGILIGKQLSPGTVLGVGFFEGIPRIRGYTPENGIDGGGKRKRRAAVGLTIGF